ncbi:MAG: cysteine hydrolase, partial [Thermoleophilia bacterium]|nr:cysteine hydrolase [Thermoleophilia bacterium]
MLPTAPRVPGAIRRGDALLVVDVLNDLSFAGGERVLPWAERLVRPLLALRARARRLGVPVIYVNDMRGLWRAGWREVLAHATRRGARGRAVAARLRPGRADYVLLKPRHSAFFETPLRSLLTELSVRRVVLTGMATNLCVLATAHDAWMHEYTVVVVSDCCAAETDFDHNVVLKQLECFFHATICRAEELGASGGGSAGTGRGRAGGGRASRGGERAGRGGGG